MMFARINSKLKTFIFRLISGQDYKDSKRWRQWDNTWGISGEYPLTWRVIRTERSCKQSEKLVARCRAEDRHNLKTVLIPAMLSWAKEVNGDLSVEQIRNFQIPEITDGILDMAYYGDFDRIKKWFLDSYSITGRKQGGINQRSTATCA